MKNILTIARLRELLHYDRETGAFHWAVNHGRYLAGERAERKAAKGYRGVTIDGKPYLCHRLAWLVVHGEWPTGDVDHRDGVRANNSAANLRHGSRSFNMQNLRRAHIDTQSKLLGAYLDKRRGHWISRICKNGKSIDLGRFPSAQAAHEAYIAAKRQLHEGCTI